MRIKSLLLLVGLWVLIGPLAAVSFGDELSSGLDKELRESKQTVVGALNKLRDGKAVGAELARVRSLGGQLRASDLLMRERLRVREAKAAALGGKAASRHASFAERYKSSIEAYLALFDAFPAEDAKVTPAILEALKAALEKLAPAKSRPLLGTLPYRHLGYPAREPLAAPTIVPAYRGGNRTVTPADTAPSAEAPASAEISALAKSLKNIIIPGKNVIDKIEHINQQKLYHL